MLRRGFMSLLGLGGVRIFLGTSIGEINVPKKEDLYVTAVEMLISFNDLEMLKTRSCFEGASNPLEITLSSGSKYIVYETKEYITGITRSLNDPRAYDKEWDDSFIKEMHLAEISALKTYADPVYFHFGTPLKTKKEYEIALEEHQSALEFWHSS